jgi:hypothetical protein
VQVNYATADVTATSGSDYVGKSDTLYFAPGETQKDVFVQLLQDTTDEPDETFHLQPVEPGGRVARHDCRGGHDQGRRRPAGGKR